MERFHLNIAKEILWPMTREDQIQQLPDQEALDGAFEVGVYREERRRKEEFRTWDRASLSSLDSSEHLNGTQVFFVCAWRHLSCFQ